jgi:S1-C subfamily serine protease
LNAPKPLTQADINAAVLHTLNTQDLPSRAARAAQLIGPSVVRVRTQDEDKKNPQGEMQDSGVGSGVVISDDGVILTNLHVVQGAKRIRVTFADGLESDAQVVAVQPENDLAVIKASRLPDDLQPATLGSSQSLQPGDEVVAVGFPFGIGPSVSAGVVSGLNRQFGAEGKSIMRGLIQADAAANPGNSGGPLINMAGEVVGIVTAILNPTSARTFIGIVFAATIESASQGMGISPF